MRPAILLLALLAPWAAPADDADYLYGRCAASARILFGADLIGRGALERRPATEEEALFWHWPEQRALDAPHLADARAGPGATVANLRRMHAARPFDLVRLPVRAAWTGADGRRRVRDTWCEGRLPPGTSLRRAFARIGPRVGGWSPIELRAAPRL